MKKSKVMLAIAVALTVSITGCGTKNSDTVESQKETVTKAADDKKAENQKKDTEKTTKKSEEAELKENVVKADEKVAAQPTVAENNTSDNSSSNDKANNSSSGNTTGNSNANRPIRNNNSNTSSGSAGSGSSSSGSNSNSSASNPVPAPAPTPAPAQPVHTHTWVHVDVTGHYETVTIQDAWDEEVPVYGNVEHQICNQCGVDISNWSASAIDDHIYQHMINGEKGGYHSEWKNEQTGTQTIHHDAVTEQRWVQDTSAYDQCSGCGAIK